MRYETQKHGKLSKKFVLINSALSYLTLMLYDVRSPSFRSVTVVKGDRLLRIFWLSINIFEYLPIPVGEQRHFDI